MHRNRKENGIENGIENVIINGIEAAGNPSLVMDPAAFYYTFITNNAYNEDKCFTEFTDWAKNLDYFVNTHYNMSE